jgi:RNA polymerase sigma-70 factor (ECF subfamily)
VASEVLKSALAFLLPERTDEVRPRQPARQPLDVKLELMLVRRVQSGDEKAFAQLVRANQDFVYDLTCRLLGDEAEAEDVAQEVFAAVFRSLPSFKGESRLSTWIFRIAKNHCLNRLKYHQRRDRGRQVALDTVPEGVLLLPGGPAAPDRLLEGREEQRLVEMALEVLDEDHRLLVVMRDIEGMSYEEIAAATEQPEGTVKSRLHRARQRLAEEVGRLSNPREGKR